MDLAGILSTPSGDAAIEKRRTKRITGARDLTADDFTEMLCEDLRKKKEAEEEKQKRKEESIKERRERKKKETELKRARRSGG